MSGDLDLVRQLAAADRGLAVVSTTRPDGTVHSSVVNAGVFDHPLTKEPTVALVAQGSAYKLRLFAAAVDQVVPCLCLHRLSFGWTNKKRPRTPRVLRPHCLDGRLHRRPPWRNLAQRADGV